MSPRSSFQWTKTRLSRLRSSLTIFMVGPLILSGLLSIVGFITIGFDDEMLLIFLPIILSFGFCLWGIIKLQSVFKDDIKETKSITAVQQKIEPLQETKKVEPPKEELKEEPHLVETEEKRLSEIKEESNDEGFLWDREIPTPKKSASNFSSKKVVQKSTNWEEWIGKQMLQKVGMVIVLIGVLYLLKESYDALGVIGRIGIGALSGVLFLAAGEWFQKQYRQWSFTFTGAGLVIFYLVVWAARVYYHDALLADYGLSVSAGMAMGLYSLITLVGVLASVRYNSQVIAWFAIAGGYLTPLLIQSQTSDPLGITLYLVILTVGILLLGFFQKWRYLNLVGFILTHLYLSGVVYPDPLLADTMQFAIGIGFFLLFGIIPIVQQFRLQKAAKPDDIVLIVLNGCAVFLTVVDALGGIAGEYTGLVSLGLAAVYLVYAALSLERCKDDPTLINTYLLASIILISLALLKELTLDWVMVGWGPFSLVLLLVAKRLKQPGPFYCALGLLIGTAFTHLLSLPTLQHNPEMLWSPLTSPWSLKSYAVLAVLCGWTYLGSNVPYFNDGQKKHLSVLLHSGIALLLFTSLTLELAAKNTFFDFSVNIPFALGYLGFSAFSLWMYLRFRVGVWLMASLLVQAIVFCITFLFSDGMRVFEGTADVLLLHPWAGVSVLSLAVTGFMLSQAQRDTHNDQFLLSMKPVLLIALLGHVWLHGTIEVRHITEVFNWSSLHYARALSAWWIAFSGGLFAYGWHKHKKVFVTAGLLTLILPFVKDITFIIEHRSFIEVMMWTAISIGLLYAGSIRNNKHMQTFGMFGIGIIAFLDILQSIGSPVLLNGHIVHTIWWTIVGVMLIILGFTVQNRAIRKLAIALFAAAAGKLLLFDLAVLETTVRIVASILTGLLMIGASYVYQRFDRQLEREATNKA